MTNLLSIFLLEAAATPSKSPLGGGYMQILMFALIILVFYLFFIRPQMKKSKDQKKFREALKKGDKVITIGGIHGRIAEVEDTTVVLEVGNNVRLTFEKSAIAMDSTSTIEQAK